MGSITTFPITTITVNQLTADPGPLSSNLLHEETAGGTDYSLSLSALMVFLTANNYASGPVSAVSGNVPSFNGIGGELLQDSGVAAGNVVTSAATGVSGNVPSYNGAKGVSDSGVAAANIAQGPASAVSGNLPSFNGTGGKLLQDSGVFAASVSCYRQCSIIKI